MTFSVERHPEAQEELLDAVEYYEDLNPGLGDTFLNLVDIVENSIIAMPEAWPKVPGWRRKPVLRSHRTGKYPYRIVYYVEKKQKQIVVIAYAHTSRKPNYWAQRVRATSPKGKAK